MCFSGRHAKRMAPRVGPVVLLGSRRGERVDGHGELSVLEAAAELSVMSGEEAERGSHGREWAKQYDMRLPFFFGTRVFRDFVVGFASCCCSGFSLPLHDFSCFLAFLCWFCFSLRFHTFPTLVLYILFVFCSILVMNRALHSLLSSRL